MKSSYQHEHPATTASNRNQSQLPGFVEISEEDTPYYKYMNMNTQMDGRDDGEAGKEQERIVEAGMLLASLNLRKELEKVKKESVGPSNAYPTPSGSSNYRLSSSLSHDSEATPRKTKNSIFDMDFSITKPITQMTETELLEYKGSLGIDCDIIGSGVGVGSGGAGLSSTFQTSPITGVVDSAIGKSIPATPLDGNATIIVPVRLQVNEPASVLEKQYHHQSQQQQQMQIQTLTDPVSSNSLSNVASSAFKPSFLRHESLISGRASSSADLWVGNQLEKDATGKTILATITKKESPFHHHPVYLSYLPITKNYLGEGQFSTVYRGTYNTSSAPFLQIPCAIKASHKGEDSYASVLQEVVILYHLGILGSWSGGSVNPHVIGLVDVKQEADLIDSTVYADILDRFARGGGSGYWPPTDVPEKIPRLLLVLEYCEHGDMDSWLSRNPRVLGTKLFFKWAEQIALGLAALHSAGIIHHDIKPHNIMLTEVYNVRIGDFGSAKFVPLVDQFFRSDPTSTTSWWKNGNYPVASNQATPPIDVPSSPFSFQFPLIVPERSGSMERNPLHCFDLSTSVGRGTISYSAPELFSKPTSPLSTTTTPSFPLPPLPASYSFPVDIYAYGATLYTLISSTGPFSNIRSTTQLILTKTLHGFFAPGAQSLVSKWKQADPTDFQWQFPDLSACSAEICGLVQQLVQNDERKRPSALEVVRLLQRMTE